VNLASNGFEIEAELLSAFSPKRAKIIEIPVTYHAREKAEAKITGFDGIRIFFYLFKYRLRRPASSNGRA
jgi:hypothetical protein